jgi:hypothetical protein
MDILHKQKGLCIVRSRGGGGRGESAILGGGQRVGNFGKS